MGRSSASEESDLAATELTLYSLSTAEEAHAEASAELRENMRNMVNNPDFSDVVFVCSDDKQVQASRTLLAGRSVMLRSMFKSGMKESSQSEVRLPEISSPVLLSVFEFLHTGELLDYSPQGWTMACQLIAASRFFLLPKLEMITRLLMHEQISVIVGDLTKVASLLTEAVGYKDLCGKGDVTLTELVRILSSSWLNTDYVQNLSEDALQYLLENSKGNSKDDGKLSFRGYLRFRQVIRWWIHQSQGSEGAEQFVNSIAPDPSGLLSLCKNQCNLPRIVSPRRDADGHASDWSSLQKDEALTGSVMRLTSHIDCRLIHPTLLAEVVEPLRIISSKELLNAFRFHALQRQMMPNELIWECGKSHETSEKGFLIQKANSKIGFSVMNVPMYHQCGVYEWRIVIKERPITFCDLGFLSTRGLDDIELKIDDQRLIHQQGAKAADYLAYLTVGSAIVFKFTPSAHTCSVTSAATAFGPWTNLPIATYYPAVCLGDGNVGGVHIELLSGFDLL